MSAMSGYLQAADEDLLNDLQQLSFQYFKYEMNQDTGLVADKTADDWPASTSSTGMALASYIVGLERGFMGREEVVRRTLTTLRFFASSAQSTEEDASGYKGFYYHFLDLQTGKRAFKCELSTVDTAYLMIAILLVSAYFQGNSREEQEIRDLAEYLYRRVDWNWAMNGQKTICHGWKPELGFLKQQWDDFNEAILMYILAAGSPDFPISRENYLASKKKYEWKKIYDWELIYAGPLFIHQYPHMFIDFRGIQDDYTREKKIDYFLNSNYANSSTKGIRDPQSPQVCWLQ